ncbi:hypothetical protein [Lentzea sp. NPDC004782]|uniref:hypothetical protein n=1 Tax=Lentzea sp. NPDC004782 TaxID=3154458 RepID=UPI0033AB512B
MINLDDVNTVVGFLITWIIRDSERFKGQSRNRAIDRHLEELARVVTEKLDDDSLISRVRTEVSQTTELRPRTRHDLISALSMAMADREWAMQLHGLVSTLEEIADSAAEPPDSKSRGAVVSNTISGMVHGTVVQVDNIHGDISIRRERE